MMPVYLVERVMPGFTVDQLEVAQRAALEMSMRFTARGERVRYIRSTFIPGESRRLCLNPLIITLPTPPRRPDL